MAVRDRMSGNEAIAYAMRQINPDVMGAFPITPSTEIPQYFSKYIADGKVDTEFVAVESEHSAMSTCIGASAAGARAITATSSAAWPSCGSCCMWRRPAVCLSPWRWSTGADRPDQHQLRSFRFHGMPRYRMDSDLRGEQPGGLRQLCPGHADLRALAACRS